MTTQSSFAYHPAEGRGERTVLTNEARPEASAVPGCVVIGHGGIRSQDKTGNRSDREKTHGDRPNEHNENYSH
jgi:hypothetical protein